MKNQKIIKHKRRQKRVRGKIVRKSDFLRMTIYRSNKHIYIQVIDDKRNHTIASSSDQIFKNEKMKNSEKAVKVGLDIAKKLQEKKITQVVFDRSGYAYRGRVKTLVETVRNSGVII